MLSDFPTRLRHGTLHGPHNEINEDSYEYFTLGFLEAENARFAPDYKQTVKSPPPPSMKENSRARYTGVKYKKIQLFVRAFYDQVFKYTNNKSQTKQ